MDSWDLKKWRKKHGFNQFEAANKLGINRGGFQNWERDVRPISKAVELACLEVTRTETQRQDFGPVILVYSKDSVLRPDGDDYEIALLRCEKHSNVEGAINEALGLDLVRGNALIIGADGAIVWDNAELFDETKRRRSTNPDS